MIGFGVNLADTKANFFDRAKVIAAVDKADQKNLSRFGAFVQRRARTSIKRAPKKASTRLKRGISADGVSSPGNPPVSHGQELLKNFILFAYDPRSKSVLIGPEKLEGRIGNAPEALEKGGESAAMQNVGFGAARQRKLVKTKVRRRAYMQPAFDAELPGVDALWANSIR